MPAKFDPVRDAVLNSPTIPSGKPPSFAGAPRRATDLSVMLNAAEEKTASGPPIPIKRTNSLSMLLNDVDVDDNDGADGYSKLGGMPSLRRAEDQRQPQIQRQQHQHHQQQSRHRPNSATTDATTSRPSSASSSTQQLQPPTPRTTVSPLMPPPRAPPPTAHVLPYKPVHRISPPGSMLKPMSESEATMFKSYIGKGTARLARRKRKRGEEDDPSRTPPTKKLAGDVGVVVNHCTSFVCFVSFLTVLNVVYCITDNSRPDVGVVQRQDSPIIGLKNFNNWVKSVIISRFAQPVLAAAPFVRGARGKGKVLDMGCGKGGDMMKWAKARIRELVAVDIAAVSVDQAEDRWQTMRSPKFQASFAALDCYNDSLSQGFHDRPYVLEHPFDVVSMQFCMHYAFESEEKARQMLDNVSRWMRPGGVFLGTIPNAEQLMYVHLISSYPKDHFLILWFEGRDSLEESDDLTFGNPIYNIRFETQTHPSLYGHKYWFYLQDAVEDVPEYVVHWDNFVNLASEYDLYPAYKAEFHEVFSEHQEHPEYGPLLQRMKVVNTEGESSMDEDQWEAASKSLAYLLSATGTN